MHSTTTLAQETPMAGVAKTIVRAGLWRELTEDLSFGMANDGGSKLVRILSNRGFHGLICYRISNRLRKTPLGFVGFILTRLCQIVYGMDIDPRAELAGGITIYHGVGLVIGQGVRIEPHVVLFHEVTLGIKRSGRHDGFPYVGSNTVIGAGAKLLGRICVGAGCVIGANAVVTRDIPAGCVVRAPAPEVTVRAPATTICAAR